ncbi:hypothetical protein H2200_000948 [Cladophialophora chaetospira]|uniref:Uncharacterized protein n=1 Tax=Cladophialophora chaetospira TaxID=386627 RepID=A0AA38XPJ0_9EURO|nr:hypothetical protein H2200_000948 [Cladophialophora chaetospira]
MTSTITIHSWIHHDNQADSKSHSSTKSQVFRHVAAHRKLKRQQRTLKLRASALDVLKTLQVPSKDLPRVDARLARSGDPFDTLPIPLTSDINDLLHFDQNHLTPALEGSRIRIHPSSTYLQDDLAVYGYLARIAAVKSRCCEDDTAFNIMLKMKAEAMQQLRLRLPQTNPSRLPLAVMALLFTETWCRNPQAAAVHVRLLEGINNHHGLDVDDLICVLHSDVQRAAITLETTMFVMEDKSWDSLESDYDLASDATTRTTANLPIPVQRLLDQMRQALMALDLLQAPETLQSVRQAATIKCLHVMSRLLDHYNLTSDDVEKYVALAALYRIRREARMERKSLCGITIFEAGKVLIPRLGDLLSQVNSVLPELRLWATSVGMMSGNSWFKQEFRRQAQALNIRDSSDLRIVLAEFEHWDLSHPAEQHFAHALRDVGISPWSYEI